MLTNKIQIFALLLFSAISCNHTSEQYVNKKYFSTVRTISATEDYSELGLSADGLKADTLNFKKIKGILEKHKYNKVEQLLAHLARTDSAYLSYHTFVYDSRSLQSSDYQNPRAIVFGPKANFIFSFNQNGSREHTATDAIEMLSFDEKTKSFSLREIRFKGDAKEDIGEFKGRPYFISEANPPKCLQCHSDSLKNTWTQINGQRVNLSVRPIWDTYPYWRGVYSGIDDNLISSNPQGRRKLFDESKETTNERREYNNFLAGNRKRGRYIHLPELTSDYDREVNSTLTFLLAEKNFDRIAKSIKLKINVRASKYRYNLILPLVCSTGFGATALNPISDLKLNDRLKFEYEAYITKFSKSISAEMASQAQQILDLEKHLEYDQYSLLRGENARETLQLAPIMFILGKLGLNSDSWAMRSTIYGKGFGYGVINHNLMLSSLVEELFSRAEKKELKNLFDPPAEYVDPTLCLYAKQRSIEIK